LAFIPITAIILFKRSVSPKGGNTTDNNTLILLSRYVVIDILKSGADTKVFLVRHPTLEQKLIIKQLLISALSEERFNREVQTLKNLKNPHIPLLYDIQKDNEYYYIIEEYIEGISLKSVIERNCLSTNTAIRYILKLCEILKYLHGHAAGTILYLDCRPDNVIISSDNSINLIDYGNSLFMKDAKLRHTCYGSVGFAAPELCSPHATLSPSTDVYGIGALLYYMLTGSLASDGLNSRTSKIPTKLYNIIKKCLRHKQKWRYTSIDELMVALSRLYKHQKITNIKRNTSLTISVAGSDRRVGVTHLSMSLANHLNRNGFRSYYKDSSTHDIISMLRKSNEYKHLHNINGLFTYKGLNIIPAFNETIDFNEAELIYDSDKPVVFINDCGVLDDNNTHAFDNADICILIGSGKPWEIENMYKSMQLCNKNKTFFVVNLLNGALFYRLINSQSNMLIRMPYYYDWNIPGTVGKRFLEELTDEIKKRWKE